MKRDVTDETNPKAFQLFFMWSGYCIQNINSLDQMVLKICSTQPDIIAPLQTS